MDDCSDVDAHVEIATYDIGSVEVRHLTGSALQEEPFVFLVKILQVQVKAAGMPAAVRIELHDQVRETLHRSARYRHYSVDVLRLFLIGTS